MVIEHNADPSGIHAAFCQRYAHDADPLRKCEGADKLAPSSGWLSEKHRRGRPEQALASDNLRVTRSALPHLIPTMNPPLFLAALFALLLCGLSLVADAAQAQNCTLPPLRTQMSDRSSHVVRIDDCAIPGQRSIRVMRSIAGKTPRQMLALQQVLGELPEPQLRWIDVDRDGNAELEIRGRCHDEANCEGRLYRYDPQAMHYALMLEGIYENLQLVDDMLVIARRQPKGWDLRAYRQITAGPSGFDENNAFLTLEIRTAVEALPRCVFRLRRGDGWRETPAPSPAWRQLCKQYLGLGRSSTTVLPGR